MTDVKCLGNLDKIVKVLIGYNEIFESFPRIQT